MEHKNEKTGRKRRKRLTAERKYEIFLETSKAESVTGEVLRREGIYASDLVPISQAGPRGRDSEP